MPTGIEWPASLPPCAATYTEKAEPVIIRSSVEEGPPKTRRRFTVRIVRAQMGMVLTLEQFQILDDFFYIDCNGGTVWFQFTHPWRNIIRDFRMIEAPDFQDYGALAVNTTMVLELREE